MNISQSDIENLSKNLLTPVNIHEEFYKFLIKKDVHHSFEIILLKNGQYIFVSLFIGEHKFPIEHTEFYNNKSEAEVVEELDFILIKLKINPSRVIELKNSKKQQIFTRMENRIDMVILDPKY